MRDTLAGWGLDHLSGTAELLVSELVANALIHARGALGLTVVRRHVVSCHVRDGSRELPRLHAAQPGDECGRGLSLVDTMASDWGVDLTPWGKEVWFELSEGRKDQGAFDFDA
ncbi:ATP-binding protein [Streptomyces sp. RB6PN25]|uniref:ATP-binding protein n=1 Tax=Streptomyces humicola TaxID=2953240 RepID=A0ABT1PSJ2_9ACTN|nr:ATP-binding protein [Streptomyces humicola]MCQ4080641.1 ATP-binding protein [Streptomyces humicola]